MLSEKSRKFILKNLIGRINKCILLYSQGSFAKYFHITQVIQGWGPKLLSCWTSNSTHMQLLASPRLRGRKKFLHSLGQVTKHSFKMHDH